MRSLFLLIALLSTHSVRSQENRPNYHPPLGIDLRLSGNFGEIRPGHFHTGIDLKTQGRTGLPVQAIEEGYVSRIKIQEGGYGKVLYIDHPDGNTSVYAHLERYAPDIQRFLKKVQYKHEQGPIDLYPGKGILPVERGETVARSGNSGSSTAPHLHFEIRTTESEKPIDPMLFGFDLSDRRAPVFNGLRVILKDYDERSSPDVIRSRVNDPSESGTLRRGPMSKTKEIKRVGPDRYRLKQKKPVRVPDLSAFGVRTTDRSTGTHNPLGTRKLEVFIDGERSFSFRFDTLDFSKKAFVDAHIDHPYLYEKGRTYHRCHLLPFNELPIYRRTLGDGWFQPKKDSIHKVRIVASDRAGNSSVLRFRIQGMEENWILKSHTKTHLHWKEPGRFERDGLKLRFPSKSLYHDLSLEYDSLGRTSGYSLSETHKVHTPATPLHKPFTAKIELDTLPPGCKGKLFILNRDDRWSTRVHPANFDSGQAIGEVTRFGTLSVRADTTPPRIRPVRVRSRIPKVKKEEFRFLVEDDLSGIDSYQAYMNDRWRIPYYDVKNDLIIVQVSDPMKPLRKGDRSFKLKVSDRAGNTKTFKKKVEVE